MKKQISRFSPHQTAKVFAILMAVGFLPFFALMGFVASFAPTPVGPDGQSIGPPIGMLFIFPLFYLVFGYISVAIGCWLYNFMYKFIGGIEIEYESK